MGCTCLSGYGCCHSMSKTVQVISVVDLALSIVFVMYETANFGLLTGLIKFDSNCTNCTTLRDYVPEDILAKTNFEIGNTSSHYDYDLFIAITVMAMIILVFAAFIIEGGLYSQLKTGKRLRIHVFCKKWFEWRLLLLLITVLMAVAKVWRGVYSIYFDLIMDAVTKTYRVVTLWCVKCFMKELEATVGIVYVKPPKPRKRGSLSLK